MPTIKFTREKKSVECEPGANLREVAMQSGIQLYPGITLLPLLDTRLPPGLNCHGLGSCGECRVHVVKGMENLGSKGLKEKGRIAVSWFKFGHENEVRLACQTRVNGDVEVLTQPEFNWFGERPVAKKSATE